MSRSLREGAAIQLLRNLDANNYYKEDEFFKNENISLNIIQDVLRILKELNLISTITFNNVPYYKINQKSLERPIKTCSIESEVFKFKKLYLSSYESILRQVKLIKSIKLSGEEDKLIELIDKWESVTREVIRELYDHQKTAGSIKTFVRKLGLNWEDLGFSDEGESESEYEEEDKELDLENDLNYNNNTAESEEAGENSFKRIKYED